MRALGNKDDRTILLQEIHNGVEACKKTVKTLRFKGWEGANGPSVIKEVGLSSGVMSLVRKTIFAVSPEQKGMGSLTMIACYGHR